MKINLKNVMSMKFKNRNETITWVGSCNNKHVLDKKAFDENKQFERDSLVQRIWVLSAFYF